MLNKDTSAISWIRKERQNRPKTDWWRHLSTIFINSKNFLKTERWRHESVWAQFVLSFALERWRHESVWLILYFLSRSRDGATSPIGLFCTSFRVREMAPRIAYSLFPSLSNYFLSLDFEFHLRHTEDGADCSIFILSPSFSHCFLSLSTSSYSRAQ